MKRNMLLGAAFVASTALLAAALLSFIGSLGSHVIPSLLGRWILV